MNNFKIDTIVICRRSASMAGLCGVAFAYTNGSERWNAGSTFETKCIRPAWLPIVFLCHRPRRGCRWLAPPISHHFLKEVNSPLTLFAGCLALLDGRWSGCGAILDFGGCGRVAAPVERSRRNSLLWHGSERGTGGVVQPATSVRRRVGECAGATHVIRQRELRRHLRFLGIHSALRILKPGGLLIFSTHGSYYLPRLRGDDRRRFLDGNLVVRFGSAAGSNLCSSFSSRSIRAPRTGAGLGGGSISSRGSARKSSPGCLGFPAAPELNSFECSGGWRWRVRYSDRR